MILKNSGLLLVAVVVAGTVFGCSGHSEERGSSSLNETNYMDTIPPKMKRDPEARSFFESLRPEIERKQKVRQAIKTAVATSTDPRVQAFHEFLSHWHLQWPVVKEGAFGEGGIGFSWNKELQKFQGGVDATTIIEDRYTLQGILDCDVSEDYSTVEFTNLRFSFGEVKEVRVEPGGGFDIRYNINNGKWFGLKEWSKLKESDWDFSKIGINVVSNAPIPNIREAFQ